MSHYDEQEEKELKKRQDYFCDNTHEAFLIVKAAMDSGLIGMKHRNEIECRKKIEAILQEVLNDTMQVFDFGAAKHADSGSTPNFLTVNGSKCSLHDRGSSILRHAARTFMHPGVLDEESELQELLHLMASISIIYIRHKRNIVHSDDEE